MTSIPETGDGFIYLYRADMDVVNGTENMRGLIQPLPGQPFDTCKCRILSTQVKRGGHELTVMIEPFVFAPNLAPGLTQSFYQLPPEYGRIVASAGVLTNVVANATTGAHPCNIIPQAVTGTDFAGGFFVQNSFPDNTNAQICVGAVFHAYTEN